MRFEAVINKLYPLVFSSNLMDLMTAHRYAHEFYTVHCPVIEYREVDREASMGKHKELANLWQEHVGALKVGRIILLRVMPDFVQEEKQVHKKQATEVEREVRFAIGLIQLQTVDLYPEMGDHILYGGYDYEIRRVYVRPDDLWTNTNQPLHVSMDAAIYRPGDRKVLDSQKEIG